MLIKPHIKLKRITDITSELLAQMNIKALILDVDNTMAIRRGSETVPGLFSWMEQMTSAGIGLIILSNAKPRRMSGFAGRVGLPFVALGMKPLPFGFFRAAARLHCSTRQCAIVGDQLFTDMLGGHLAFCKTILLSPIELETSAGFRLKRRAERWLLKRYHIECDF